jgi:hypothetical protein
MVKCNKAIEDREKAHKLTRFNARKNVKTANASMPTEKNGISARMVSIYRPGKGWTSTHGREMELTSSSLAKLKVEGVVPLAEPRDIRNFVDWTLKECEVEDKPRKKPMSSKFAHQW